MKKPEYDPEWVQREMIELAAEMYKRGYSYRNIASELGLSVSKVIMLLITGGEYTSEMYEEINRLYGAGRSVEEIQGELGVSRATVQAYLPYKKGIYRKGTVYR